MRLQAPADKLSEQERQYILAVANSMSPYEILQAGGSVEYNNEEAGAEWLQRFTHAYPKFIWLNPEPEGLWQYRQSVAVIKQMMNDRMFPVTIEGLERGMRLLSK